MDYIMTNWQPVAVGIVLAVAILTFFYYTGLNKIPRGLILIFVVLIEIAVLCIFWKQIEAFISEGKRVEWLKGLLPLFMAAIPAYLLWHWRDTNRRQELTHQARELKLKEDNAAWTDFIKYQKIAEDRNNEHSDGTRAAAIFALGEYYGREGTQFPQQVHSFFKNFLDEFWDKQETYHEYMEKLEIYNKAAETYNEKIKNKDTASSKDYQTEKELLLVSVGKLGNIKLPEYIKAVHKVIKDKSDKIKLNNKNLFHYENKLIFYGFNLTHADLREANFSGAILRFPTFAGAMLAKINLNLAALYSANLNNAYLGGANLNNTFLGYANLTDAYMQEADFRSAEFHRTNCSSASFYKTNLSGTKFFEANLNAVELIKTNLTAANFREANLSSAKFSEHSKSRGIFYILLLKLKILYCKKYALTGYFKGLRHYLIWGKYYKFKTTRRRIKLLFCDWKLEPDFTNAKYDNETKLPDGFNPKKAGMINVDEIEKKAN